MRKYYLFLILIVLASCIKDEFKTDPSACFNYSPDTLLLTGDTIAFSNCSENANSYLWDFGDGYTSYDEFPKHSYKNIGNYEVLLSATKGNLVDVISQSIRIQDQIFIDLHEKGVTVYNGGTGFGLDLDNDRIADIYFGGYSGHGSWSGSNTYISMGSSNGYEIFTSEGIESTMKWNGKDSIYTYKSITIPKLFKLNDTVRFYDDCTYSGIDLVSYHRELIYTPGDVIESSDWINPDYNYMAFRKKTNNGTDLIWLKVKVPSYGLIILSSYKYFKNKDKIVIETN